MHRARQPNRAKDIPASAAMPPATARAGPAVGGVAVAVADRIAVAMHRPNRVPQPPAKRLRRAARAVGATTARAAMTSAAVNRSI